MKCQVGRFIADREPDPNCEHCHGTGVEEHGWVCLCKMRLASLQEEEVPTLTIKIVEDK